MKLWFSSADDGLSTDWSLNSPPKPSSPACPLPVSQCLEYAQDILIAIFFPMNCLFIHIYLETLILFVGIFVPLHAQPCICSVGVACFALSAGSFSYFFLLGTCCDSSGISKSMQSKICQEEIFL